MPDRRRFKRVNYFASDEFAQTSVLKSWKNAIKRHEYNTTNQQFILSEEGVEHGKEEIHNI